MAKQIRTICDRCGKEIYIWDDRIADYLENQYPGRDICQDCDTTIEILKTCAQEDAITGDTPGMALKKWAAMYGISTDSQ